MKNISVLFFFLFFQGLNAQTYVDIDAIGGTNNGSSWIDAYTNLNTAIDSSSAGDIIWVAEGTYIPDRVPRDSTGSPVMNERDYTFHLRDSVALYGGFNGTETLFTERNIDSFPTILSGEVDSDLALFTFHVVLSVADSSTTIIDGFTITKGASFQPASSPPILVEGVEIERLNGSGMYNANSSPSLDSILFFQNITLLGQGAGMYNDASAPDLKNISFTENHGKEGAGMYNTNTSSPTLLNVDFLFNEGIKGIGMYNDASSPIINLSHFEGNALGTFPNDSLITPEGGGMYNNNGSNPTLTLTTFKVQQADNGAGMYNNNSNPHLLNCLFLTNLAGDNGAGIYNSGSTPTLDYVTFKFNLAGGDGGGIYNNNSSPTLNNVRIGGGSGVFGGGIFNDNSSPVITGGNISDNQAERGGGMYNINSSAPVLTNVLIKGNTILLSGIDIISKVGGGICNVNSSPELNEVIFSNNKANFGGGMSCWNSSPILYGVEFRDNKAKWSGGGMNVDSTSSPVLNDVLFVNNQTRHVEQSQNQQNLRSNRGGGMCVDNNSIPTLNNVTFKNNEASYGGGMSMDNGSNAILNNVNFVNNEARDGGGLFNLDSSPSIQNVTFDGNRARGFTSIKQFLFYYDEEFLRHKGGGMYTEGTSNNTDTITLFNVVFNNNIAEADSFILVNVQNQMVVKNDKPVSSLGGGFYYKNFSADSLITIVNATFKDNTVEKSGIFPGKGEAIYNNSNSTIGLHNSILSDGLFGESFSELDGLNGPSSISGSNNVFGNNFYLLDDYFIDRNLAIGADDQWGTSDDGLRPAFESSIINAGDNSFNSLPTDITGQDRIIGDTIDLGAYEYTECNDTTIYISGAWSNGAPTPNTVAIFSDDYDTLDPGNGSILACTCTVEEGKTLTIGEETALHVYFNGINIEGTIIVEDGGRVVNGIYQ